MRCGKGTCHSSLLDFGCDLICHLCAVIVHSHSMEFLQNILPVVLAELVTRDGVGVFLVFSYVPVETWLELAEDLKSVG